MTTRLAFFRWKAAFAAMCRLGRACQEPCPLVIARSVARTVGSDSAPSLRGAERRSNPADIQRHYQEGRRWIASLPLAMTKRGAAHAVGSGSAPSLRGAERRSNPAGPQRRYQEGKTLDCFVVTRNDEEGCGVCWGRWIAWPSLREALATHRLGRACQEPCPFVVARSAVCAVGSDSAPSLRGA
jgi:hypothetical protein